MEKYVEILHSRIGILELKTSFLEQIIVWRHSYFLKLGFVKNIYFNCRLHQKICYYTNIHATSYTCYSLQRHKREQALCLGYLKLASHIAHRQEDLHYLQKYARSNQGHGLLWSRDTVIR